ncbi:lysylphosphatidylglycerol synthase transmembrane domain-containing protein [Pedobacter rhodius]|uniref:Lysylphosphatidylglycerol synthase transmembrane domain-containing protein n=1 Tax=Pedobacter rhodius TaxID=3004098 RepID=A0ABT4KYF8_9SPHI|nr:lysylphosphatidylglycerol synthase transmembrane domain-containing protein [Pedobacter sp. SJ11]MCZ4223771.1 lysylphosphatidylglycerol synthase transmembrane domain-containing protein [Pedobacter sp. SJ11]
MAFDLKSLFKYIVLFLIGIGILYLAFKGQDLNKIWHEIKQADFLWVAFSGISVWLAHVLRAMRWRMLYQSISYKVSFWHTYHAVIIGYLANLALPRFGEIGRCSVILKTEKVPMFASIGTVITERLIDVLVLLLSGLLLLLFQYQLVSDFLYHTIYSNTADAIKSLNYFWIIGLFILMVILTTLIIYLIRKKLSKKFLRIFAGLRQGFNSYRKLKNKPLFMVYTFGIWFFYWLSLYLAFSAIQITSGLGFNAAFTALIFSSFAMIAPVQGGIGVFHWMVAQALVLYSIAFKDGLAYATIIHSSQLLLILILGGLSLFSVLLVPKIK